MNKPLKAEGPTPEIPNADWGPLAGLPGNPLMWILIGSEMLVFGAIFISFAVARLLQPDVFMDAQNHLNRLAGAINTMILLTSGFLAAMAVQAQNSDQTGKTRWLLFGAIWFGALFLGIKFVEYSEKFAAGISTDTNTFYMFYFLATGFHAVHVVFGMLILAFVGWKNTRDNVVTGVAFWHMVDLIWVILFPLIYLMR